MEATATAIPSNDGFLVTIDQVTGAVTVVGHPAGVSRLTGLAFDLTGALYATTQGPGGFPPLQVRSQPAVVYIKQINDSHVFRKPIVTQIVPPNDEFYTGKAYQQNYAVKPLQPVHRRCLSCKVEKLRKIFPGCVRKRKEA